MTDSKGSWGHEYRFQTPEGKTTWVYGLATPIHDSTGNIFGFLGVNIDITERKQAEEERENLRAQLNQAHKMEAIGTLAGGIAHDFNNLLMGIQGRTSLMMLETDRFHPSFEHLQENDKGM
jgi:signal transduction histidine kinase